MVFGHENIKYILIMFNMFGSTIIAVNKKSRVLNMFPTGEDFPM